MSGPLLYLDGITVSFDGFSRPSMHCLWRSTVARCAPSSAPNGAGKTTMMDVITGKTRPDFRHRVLRRD